MANVRDLPQMVGEFVDMAKRYLREQTMGPARALGRLAAFSVIGSIMFVLAALFLSVAGMRILVDVMPDGTVWSGLGYVASGALLLVITGLVMWRATR
jgi:hypothetical protein